MALARAQPSYRLGGAHGIVLDVRDAWRDLVEIEPGNRPAWKIILWWELRRIPFNMIVAPVGVVSLVLFYVFILNTDAVPPGEDAVEPMAIFLAPFLVNGAYTLGWIVEVPLNALDREGSGRIGPVLWVAGLAFSLFCVTLPAVFWGGTLFSQQLVAWFGGLLA